MTTLTLQDSAAAEAVRLLPTGTQLVPVVRTAASDLAVAAESAVVATFVGAPSCDVALALVDTEALSVVSGSTAAVSVADLLAPALEAATSVLGAGVLGEARIEDASSLFSDTKTVVYELLDGDTVAGWFAVRMRENGVTAVTAQLSDDSVASRLGRINDVEMSLTVEIGRTRMPVRDVLSLEPGAVIELDRSAGAPADILLNGRLIAYGEVVVIDQDYAVRVTRILDIQDGLG